MEYLRNSTVTFYLGNSISPEGYMRLARNGVCTEYAPQRFHAIIMRLRGRGIIGADAASGEGGNDGSGGGGCTALIFRSGRVVMTGVRCAPDSVQLQRLATRVCHRVCRPIRPEVQFSVNELTVRNLVGVRRLPIRVALHPLYGHLISLMDGTRHRPAPPPPPLQAQPSSSPSSSSFTVLRCVLDQCTFPALRMTLHLPQPSEMGSSSSSGDHNHNNNNNSCRTAPNRHRCTALIFSTGRLIVTGTTEMETLGTAVNILTQLCNAFHSPNNV